MMGRSLECEAILKHYGVDHCSLAVIGADKPPDFADWRVMLSGDGSNHEYLEVAEASRLAYDLRRIGENVLAARLDRAVESASGKCGRRK
jgi:hypothetical protein